MYEKFGSMGYFGLAIPEQYGGSDLDVWYTVILHEEMSRINSGGFAAAMGAHFFLAMVHINGEGNHEQKMEYLPPGCEGKLYGCMAVTEPFGGSDVKALRTTAIKDGDEYVINGSKTFITNGVNSDYIVAACKTAPELIRAISSCKTTVYQISKSDPPYCSGIANPKYPIEPNFSYICTP